MILVDGEKYACVQCIRGHRSSTCKHSQRPLVQVRSRGRPSLNQTHRIAVTESEIVLSRDQVNIQDASTLLQDAKKPKEPNVKSCCSATPKIKPDSVKKPCSSCSSESCKTNGNGVILLKASKRQFVDVVEGNLDFVGPYKGSSTNSFKLSDSKRAKHVRSSKCQNNLMHVKLKALKTLRVNEVKLTDKNQNQMLNTTNLNSHPPNPQFDFDKVLNDFNRILTEQTYNTINNSEHNYHDISTQSSTNTHLQYPQQNQSQYNPPQLQMNFQNPSTSSFVSLPRESTPNDHKPQAFDMFLGEGCADECNCGPSCSCPGCLIHRTNEELREYGILDSSTSGSTPSDFKVDESVLRSSNNGVSSARNYDQQSLSSSTANSIKDFTHRENSPEVRTPNGSLTVPAEQLINFETIDELFIQEMLDEDCYCEENACRCYHCLKHGISNGVRLKDGVRVFEVNEFFNSVPSANVEILTDNTNLPHKCGCSPSECECFHCPQHGIFNGVRIGNNISK